MILDRGRWYCFEASKGKHATERASERWWCTRGMYVCTIKYLNTVTVKICFCFYAGTAMCIFWFSTYLRCLYRKVRLKSQKCYIKSPCQTCVNYTGIKFWDACSEILNVSKFGHLKPLKLSLSHEAGYQTSYFRQQRFVLEQFKLLNARILVLK